MALLEGKTAVITGGSTGIGLATARRFVDEGACVFITGRRQAELEAAVKELGDQAVGVAGDVSNQQDLDRVYGAVADSGRRIDVVFASAAVIDVARIGEITEEHLDYQLSVDFKGVVFTVQKALPLLNDGASIILNSSNSATKGYDGVGVYAAIKASLRSFARSWASELRSRGIRVNAISPGSIDTPGLELMAGLMYGTPDAPQRYEEHQRSVIPLSRYGTADEVAGVVLFLASDLSSYITGSDIPIDGGLNQI